MIEEPIKSIHHTSTITQPSRAREQTCLTPTKMREVHRRPKEDIPTFKMEETISSILTGLEITSSRCRPYSMITQQLQVVVKNSKEVKISLIKLKQVALATTETK